MIPADAPYWTATDRVILRQICKRYRRLPGEYVAMGLLVQWQMDGQPEPVSPVPSDDATDLDDLHGDRIYAADLKAWWPIIPAPKGLDA